MKTLVSFLNRLVSRFVDSESAKKSNFTKKRKLTMEILENRELLSANIYDDSSTYNNLYFNEQQYSTEQYDTYSNSSDTSTTSDYSTSSSTTLPIYLNNLLDDGNSTFNGTSDYFQISDTNTVDTLDQLTQITVAARFKADVTSGWHYILAHDVETNRGNELFLRIRDNNLQFGYWTTSKNVQAQTPVTADTWYDVVGTYDGTSWKLYLNGELKSTVNDANRNIGVSNVSVDGDPLNPVWLIGEHDEVLDRRFWDGEINFVAIYDTALTEDEVEDLYNEKDNWDLTLTVPTGQNSTTAAFSENHEDTFDVTVKRTNNAVNADKSYPIDFSLTFSGETSKDDFEIYDGEVLISSDSSRWSSNDTIFSYTIPANSTSVVLTFKVLNDAEVEGNETLGISLSSATGTVDGVTKDFDYSSTTKNITIKDNDWYISVSTSDTSITEKVSDNEDEDEHYLTYTFSRGDDGDLDVPVEFTFKLTGTAVYSDKWTDFWLYDENDEEIALTYDSTEEAFFGTLAIATDASEVAVKLKPRDNIFYEPDETVTIEVIGVDYNTNDASDPDAVTYTLLTDSDSTATITISTEDTLLYPIPDEDRPTMPALFEPMSIGLQDFDLDPTTLFTPLVSGTYWMKSEGEQTVGETTEDMSIKIVSLAYVNGDWKYFEKVTWNYDTIDANGTNHSWGTFEYEFYAWNYDGSQGFTFTSTTEDNYDFTNPYDDTDSAQTRTGEIHQWGESSETIEIESNYSDDNATDERTVTSEDNLSGSGTYSYTVEGGTVSGTFSESEYWYEYSSTEISLTKSDETWTSTGTYSGESSGDSSSEYDGSGDYTIDETTSEGNRNVTGSITESGSTESEYEYTTSGTLSSNGWSMTGDGSENLTEESSYENEEDGIYVTEILGLDGVYISSYTTETIEYSDEYSLERDIEYELSDGTWETTSGSETEESTTTDKFKAETDAYRLESGTDFGTQYYELTISNYYDEYDVTRSIDADGNWSATSGDSSTTEYEVYQSDVMVETASYTRTFSQGTMSGKLGWLEREIEKFYYTSESEINNGDWQLESGTGYYKLELSYGNFANGSNNNNTESWKQLTGTLDQTDYAIEDNEWTIDEESESVVDLLEYLYNDESATIPSNYRTINVDEQAYDDFADYFESVADNSLSSSTSMTSGGTSVMAYAGTSGNNQSNNSSEPPNSDKLSTKPDNPLGKSYSELWDQLWDSMSDGEKQRMKELIGWGWKFEFYNMYNSYDIALARRTIYIDYRHFTWSAWTNEQLIATIKTAINDSLLPTMKYTIAEVFKEYNAIFGENEPLLQVYQSTYHNNGVGVDEPNNIIEMVPLKGNEKISGGVAWQPWKDRIAGAPDYYVIRISDQCRDVTEAAILLYKELEESKTSTPMQKRIHAQDDVDLSWGMAQAVYEQQVVPAVQNFVTAMQTCAAVAYEPVDWAIAISEAVEKKDPTYLAVAAVPFVPAAVVNTVKTAKKINIIKGAAKTGDTLPSGIGSVVTIDRGVNSANSVQYQAQVTGFPFDHEYALKYSKSNSYDKTVKFDGAKVENINGVDLEIFIETKGLRLDRILGFSEKAMNDMVDQAKRQVEAILENGVVIDLTKHKPLEWHFAEEGAKVQFYNRLNNSNKPVILSNGNNLLDYIQLIHTPFNP